MEWAEIFARVLRQVKPRRPSMNFFQSTKPYCYNCQKRTETRLHIGGIRLEDMSRWSLIPNRVHTFNKVANKQLQVHLDPPITMHG